MRQLLRISRNAHHFQVCSESVQVVGMTLQGIAALAAAVLVEDGVAAATLATWPTAAICSLTTIGCGSGRMEVIKSDMTLDNRCPYT